MQRAGKRLDHGLCGADRDLQHPDGRLKRAGSLAPASEHLQRRSPLPLWVMILAVPLMAMKSQSVMPPTATGIPPAAEVGA